MGLSDGMATMEKSPRRVSGMLLVDRCGSEATSDASGVLEWRSAIARVRGVKLGEDRKANDVFRAASHAFDRRKAARRAAASGAVSALTFESPLTGIWVETMGRLALGSRPTRSTGGVEFA